MFGHQVTRERPSNKKVHTFGMHHFFYGFTLMEMVITIAMLSLLLFPLSYINMTKTPIDEIIHMKRMLYQSEVNCINQQLWVNSEWTLYECIDIPNGIQIHMDMVEVYYVQS